MTVNDASLGERGSKLSKVAATSLLMGVTRASSEAYLTKAFPSMAAILEGMQTIRCIEHDGRRKFITPFVGDQVTICDAFGFEIPEGCRPTYTSRKSTKGRCGRPAKPQTETS